jgi:hypothetical protein
VLEVKQGYPIAGEHFCAGRGGPGSGGNAYPRCAQLPTRQIILPDFPSSVYTFFSQELLQIGWGASPKMFWPFCYERFCLRNTSYEEMSSGSIQKLRHVNQMAGANPAIRGRGQDTRKRWTTGTVDQKVAALSGEVVRAADLSG